LSYCAFYKEIVSPFAYSLKQISTISLIRLHCYWVCN